MINEITGDLIRDGKGVICHQVNYQGVMGGGVAYAIKTKLLSDDKYREYQNHCQKHGLSLLGTNWLSDCGHGVVVANMFCQNAAYVYGNGCLTNYQAMLECFASVREFAEFCKLPIFIPGHIGCGIAGGDWNIVKTIIQYTLGEAKVPVTIVYRKRETT